MIHFLFLILYTLYVSQVLLRSAQPLVGPNHHCCEDDEMFLDAALMGQCRGFIIDIRTELEAKQARSAGGGTENKDRYPKWSVLHRPLGRCVEQRQ